MNHPEKYIFRKLKALKANPDIPPVKIKEQNRTAFWQSRDLRADIIIESKDKSIVLDTKWKVLRKLTPSDDDLKQMFVYNHYDTELSVLLYPKTDMETMNKKPFSKFERQHCQIGFVDIFIGKGKLEKNLGKRIYNNILRREIEE